MPSQKTPISYEKQSSLRQHQRLRDAGELNELWSDKNPSNHLDREANWWKLH